MKLLSIPALFAAAFGVAAADLPEVSRCPCRIRPVAQSVIDETITAKVMTAISWIHPQGRSSRLRPRTAW
jgi:hypothetical protein